LDDEASGLTRLVPSLSCDDALLVVQRLPDDQFAVLENSNSIAKDEVNCACDGAVTVELALGVGIEGVLVTIYLAIVEDRHVSLDSECHGLVSYCSGRVLKSNVLGHEVISRYCCMVTNDKALLENKLPDIKATLCK
jgi:hypothetical protein